MSNQTRIYGYIEIPRWRGWDEALVRNEAVLADLPAEGEWPWLVRDMFHTAPERVTYRSGLIHFAADMKGLDEGWHLWLEKFEDLLRSMRWFSVMAHLETENRGHHCFLWTATDRGCQGTSTSEWTFYSGPDGSGDAAYSPPLRAFSTSLN